MLIKSLVTGAAFALAISVGSASAAEDFATTSNVPAEPLTASQMAAGDFSAMSAVFAAPLTASEMARVVGAYVGNTAFVFDTVGKGWHWGLMKNACTHHD